MYIFCYKVYVLLFLGPSSVSRFINKPGVFNIILWHEKIG